MDYVDLIKASQVLCQSPAIGKTQFFRAIFNLFSCNQDDHSKNWAFLMNDSGTWKPTPFYDITFSPTPHNQHITSFNGYGNKPPLQTIQYMSQQANFSHWNEARESIEHIIDAIHEWDGISIKMNISRPIRQLISKQLNKTWKDNKHLVET